MKPCSHANYNIYSNQLQLFEDASFIGADKRLIKSFKMADLCNVKTETLINRNVLPWENLTFS